MTEVVPADRTQLLQSKRAECNAIARSRKRKLCILYEFAASPDGSIPQRSFANPDAQPTTPAEKQFLEACDILQGRRLNELNIPARRPTKPVYPPPSAPSAHAPALSPNGNVAPAVSKQDVSSAGKPAARSSPGPSPGLSAPAPKPSGNLENLTKVAPLPSSTEQVSQPPHGTIMETNGSRISSQTPSQLNNNHSAGSIRAGAEVPSRNPLKTDHNNIPPHPALRLPPNSSAQPPSTLPSPKSGRPSNTPQHEGPAHTVNNGQERQVFKDSTRTEVIVPAGTQWEANGVMNNHTPLPDPTRAGEALSSPGSTAPSATTPAVLDTSANTSPDHDGAPFAGTKGDKIEQDRTEEHTNGLSQQQSQELEALLVGHRRTLVGSSVQGLPGPLTGEKDAVGGTTESGTLSKTMLSLKAPTTAETPSTPASETRMVGGEELKRKDDRLLEVTNGATSVRHIEQPPVPEAMAMDISSATEVPKSMDTLVEMGGTGNASSPAKHLQQPDQDGPESCADSVTQRSDRGPLESSSGVALQKPVSEILGERLESPSTDSKSRSESRTLPTAPITPTSQSSKSRSRGSVQKAKAREKNRVSTVVFGKQPARSDPKKPVVQNEPKTGHLPSDDYFTPLFVNSFAQASKTMKPLDQILNQAHKTLSTTDSYTQILDNQACRVLRRVYSLQHHDKWSLRQPKRCPEPPRQECHWDVVMQEMKWMRTDFRGERKWKMAAARNLAYACAEWVSASAEDRKALQVNAVIPPKPTTDVGEARMLETSHAHGPDNHLTPDLTNSAETESALELDDEPVESVLDCAPPSAIFNLPDDEMVFPLRQSPNTDRLLQELPMYGSPLKIPKSDLISPDHDPDASWKRPALPISKYVEGQMRLTPTEPPRKRRRFQYAEEDEEDDKIIFGADDDAKSKLSPGNPEVALFRPENKSIRDRLHAGHQFRPPNEHSMPFQTFYESRHPSQWTQSEDDELKSLVREYSYNWSLISTMLSTKSVFASGAERRTPWECFERWVMLEGLPHDMQKTQYFKLWQGRIESAHQLVRQQNALQQQAQQQQAQQQQAQQQQQQAQQAQQAQQGQGQAQQQQQQQTQQPGASAPVVSTPRRRFSQPLRVERRRNQKHLTMIDAMRKLYKKRETTLQKQQHSASLAAMRKPNEAPQPRAPIKTPREYSIMRWERDQAMAERLAERMAAQQRLDAQRRVRTTANTAPPASANPKTQAAMQRAQQNQAAQLAATQNTSQHAQSGGSGSQMAAAHPHAAAMARANNAAAAHMVAANGQNRPRMPMHPTPNGNGPQNHMPGSLVPPMQMNGSPPVQMPVVDGQSRMAMPNSQPNLQLLMQVQRISEQQRQSVQMRQQQSHQGQQANTPSQGSPPAMRAAALQSLNQKNFMNNAQAQAMMASLSNAGASGMSTPPANGFNVGSGQAGSPRPSAMIPQQPPQTYVSQLQQIENHIRQQNPNAPQEVVRDTARSLLQSRHNTMAQSAMNAAAGGSGQTAVANGPHQYAQLLRAQQQQQAAAAAQVQAAQHQRHSSGSATPTPSMPK
ncbi:hypothetical protein F4778DRAFT_635393 [Xylariomycetidae sp. FL2044]|nr:hypothetical protein F4778DRAFT_635393 [Xylariomycetidae sp. FL2044]